MGLYIAGLRMPKPGTYTKFTVYSDGRVVLHFGGKYIGDAVEVKKPHGRLIDSSTKVKIQIFDETLVDYYDKEMSIDELLNKVREIEKVPTIIEAEMDG